MARKSRSEEINENEIGIYHLTSRCVQRMFLCGVDQATGKSYEYRREWIEDRLVFLARIFLIDLIGHGILGNHLHNVVRNRPDLVNKLSNQEVAARWWRLTRRGDPDAPIGRRDRNRIEKILRDKEALAKYRRRLSSISWLMSSLKKPIAVRANRETDSSGHFWDGRFKTRKIESIPQLVAAMVYVDLNPIRAGIAETPEESHYTSVYNRIQANLQRRRRARTHRGQRLREQVRSLDDLNATHQQLDAWLSPIDERDESELPTLAPSSKKEMMEDRIEQIIRWPLPSRASNMGCLPMSLEQYLQLVDWTGRQTRRGKKGRIPKNLIPILSRLGMRSGSEWLPQLDEYAQKASGTYSLPVNPRPRDGAATTVFPVTHPNVRHEEMFF